MDIGTGLLQKTVNIHGRNLSRIGLSCGIDIRQHHVVSESQHLGKLREKCLGSCVSMRLENNPELIVRIFPCRCEGSADFCRMMCIVIDNHNIAKIALILKTTMGSGKGKESGKNLLHRKSQALRTGNGCQRVHDVVAALDTELNASGGFSVNQEGIRAVSLFVKCHVGSRIIIIRAETESNGLLDKTG